MKYVLFVFFSMIFSATCISQGNQINLSKFDDSSMAAFFKSICNDGFILLDSSSVEDKQTNTAKRIEETTQMQFGKANVSLKYITVKDTANRYIESLISLNDHVFKLDTVKLEIEKRFYEPINISFEPNLYYLEKNGCKYYLLFSGITDCVGSFCLVGHAFLFTVSGDSCKLDVLYSDNPWFAPFCFGFFLNDKNLEFISIKSDASKSSSERAHYIANVYNMEKPNENKKMIVKFSCEDRYSCDDFKILFNNIKISKTNVK